jgi:hypothetical protein
VAQQKQPPEVRRVVTKLDESGKAVVMRDGAVQLRSVRPPNSGAEMWVTDVHPDGFAGTLRKSGSEPDSG